MRARVGDAESLLQLAAERDLVLCLPPGTITRVGYARQPRLPSILFFASEDLASSVIKCYADGGHGSNHREVNTVLDLQIRRAETEERLNWRQTDWEKFAQVAEDSLTALGSQGSLTSREALDGMVQKVVESSPQPRQRPFLSPSPLRSPNDGGPRNSRDAVATSSIFKTRPLNHAQVLACGKQHGN